MRWPLIRSLPSKTNFQFVRFSKFAATFSIIALIASLTACFIPGLKLGIEFKGGTTVEMASTSQPLPLEAIRGAITHLNLGDVKVQNFQTAADKAGAYHASIDFQTPTGADPGGTVTKVQEALTAVVPDAKFSGVEVVGSQVSGEQFLGGIMALGVAIFLMLLFVWFRFRLSFGLGAVAALFHDVILTFGLIVLLRIEFSLNIVAAILTIIGYSMNDTVVVFDRLRENLRKYKKMPLREVIDLSVNETLSRTVITGLTAVLALSGLAIFGGEALRGLSLALLFGIVIGTYSSIYIASPIVLIWGIKRGEEDDAKPIDWTAAGRSVRPAPKP